MPEGDTVLRHQLELGARLRGEPLREVWVRGIARPGLAGRAVTDVQARGKNLIVTLDEGGALRIHLGIAGAWRRREPAALSAAMRRAASLVLVTARDAFVLWKAPVVEVTRAAFLRGHPVLSGLGPDLLGPAPDLDLVLARARAPERAGWPVGELLLDQRVAAGIGNVHKCEALFGEKIDPWKRVGAMNDDSLRRLFVRAREQLLTNVGDWPRTTTADRLRGRLPRAGMGRYHVYGRRGRPCWICGSPIESRMQGEKVRPTYWCPRCQVG